MAEPRPVAIFGTGAMAMLFGARLARAGPAVSLYGGWREGLEAIAARGIEVEGSGGVWRARVGAVQLAGAELGSPPAALALVLAKSHQTAGVAPAAGAAVAPDGRVLTLQNGLGNRRALEAHARTPVVVGTTTAAATVLGPGRVREVARGRTVLPAAERALAEVLAGAGFEVELVRDPRPQVWLKLAVNCAINPLAALERLPNGGLLELPGGPERMSAAAAEVGAVAAALGIELPADPAAAALRVARDTAANRCSMLQDVLRGARTEIDALSGAVVRHGRRLGVATPVNEALWRRVRRLEGGGSEERRPRDRARRPERQAVPGGAA